MSKRTGKDGRAVIKPEGAGPLKPGMKWQPVVREQAAGVVKRTNLSDEAKRSLLETSAEILGKGVNPAEQEGRVTGLVVGQVQSGKTLSFTTVIGLARDNGFPIVIVIAGNKTPLLKQSHERLERDLDVNGGDGPLAWITAKNLRNQDAQYEQVIKQTLENWQDDTRDPDEKPTLLLTVLKQNQRLSALTALLRKMDLRGVPALIIDDEADQASLNTKVKKGGESTTYTRLRELRDALPCHTLLQYTATPQAPLLINIADTLSPDFVHVLEPGQGYVGGSAFFYPKSPYIKLIPPGDIQATTGLQDEPPESLLNAMRVFFVGLAASIIGRTGKRSMLIHPSRETFVHERAAAWATAAKDNWIGVLGAKGDPDRDDVVGELKEAYEELAVTEKELPSFAEILEKLPRALRNTIVMEFNTRGQTKTPEINWRAAEGWILVGGQAVDRGFTVDSLSVTYMPRGIGGGNADTLQQRARFFGYAKARGYFGVCRVYLERDLKEAFEDYLQHEEIMRRELKEVAAKGTNLRQWRRRFILDPSLHPCRRSVISDPYTRASQVGGWTRLHGALVSKETQEANANTLREFIAKLQTKEDDTFAASSATQKHLVDHRVPLSSLIAVLDEYRYEDPRDTAGFTGLLISLAEGLRQNPKAMASVYVMRPGVVGERKLMQDGRSIEIFQQGPTAIAGGGYSYPGDAFFKSDDQVSLQIHFFDLTFKDKPVAKAAPLITAYLSAELAQAWLIQIQRGQA